ncbi:pyridoxamine 5'-phosphate oxidase family protein [Novosphingobium sp. RL4]|uniref:pyridoxamine 5'-phosphate oxidase family protein n=1 Tax=Novosphingobium sp. RL4 TaxID=3109595 RepID=UPI002D764E21|nr:pyridoxamine 5'-phosphate oxidase family protein [Novosphingobium sp. RL4]WRT91722.1 pyridoxamine 5'-phosphate oxidase family protein [Novosphingobium sp. RL4]
MTTQNNATYLKQKDKMPSICPKEREDEIREAILQKLYSAELMYLSTISPDGWPIVDCIHFTTIKGNNKKPIFYIFTHENVRKIENILNDNRVGISICHAVSYEQRNETWSFQFMGKATIIGDNLEKQLAINSSREKVGYDFTKYLPLEKQPCIKIEPIFGSWMSGQLNPPACSIDYFAE